MTADDLLTAAKAAAPNVIGLSITDEADAATWRFDGLLTEGEKARAIAAVSRSLVPAVVEPDQPVPITAEAVLDWVAQKLNIDPMVATLEVLHGAPITADPLPIEATPDGP